MAKSTTKCPKCKESSGYAWTQCKGDCPMLQSPHYHRCTTCAFSREGLAVWGSKTTWCDNPASRYGSLLTPDANTCQNWVKK